MKKRLRNPTSIWMSSEAKRLRDRLSDKLGISKKGIFEIAIRRLAESEGIKVEEDGRE